MKKPFALSALFILCASTVVHAKVRTLVDENFRVTFSDYGALNKMLTCRSGYRGGFATHDELFLAANAIEAGLIFDEDKNFRAESSLGLANDPKDTVSSTQRPYAEGCKLAIDQLKASIAGKKVVEVDVHHEVEVRSNFGSRAYRDVSGNPDHTNTVTSTLYYETLTVNLGGFEFKMSQQVNGAVKSD